MGMSLWRMYSAREQDQPPSVLLVGTFCKKRQETGPGVDYLMPRVSRASRCQKAALPFTSEFPWRTCFASRNIKVSCHSSCGPLIMRQVI